MFYHRVLQVLARIIGPAGVPGGQRFGQRGGEDLLLRRAQGAGVGNGVGAAVLFRSRVGPTPC
ncbi:MAG: hypothetical protein V9H69_21265 [Anaerolineae bacterium]